MSIQIGPQLRVLDSPTELHDAQVRHAKRGLCPSTDPGKVWDNLLAVEILEAIGRKAAILDVGCRSGILLPWLTETGFDDLWGVDTRLPLPPIKAAITRRQPRTLSASLVHLVKHWRHLRRASGERLPFADGQFAAVTCMSVIEHGVNVDRFLEEAYRVLAIGGYLIISTDFWYEPLARTSRLFGAPDVVFAPVQIESMLRNAARLGFDVPPPPRSDGHGATPMVQFGGQSYTFLLMLLIKAGRGQESAP